MSRKAVPSGWEGFLNLDKPTRMSSGDCVYRLRRLFAEKRIGHGGTLDPSAIGVLPIAVGRVTRLVDYLAPGKGYLATIRFGITTDTDDLDGTVLTSAGAVGLARAVVEARLGEFVGEIDQRPPRYSAIHQDGRRLYELARKGEAPDLEEIPRRRVRIDALDVIEWLPGNDYAEIVLEITCSTGTYIRSIARDLGERLGCGGTLARLVRTRSGCFVLTDSLSFEEVEAQLAARTLQLLGPDAVLTHLPVVQLDPELARRWSQGQRLAWEGPAGIVQIRVEEQFLGIARIEDGTLHPQVVLVGR